MSTVTEITTALKTVLAALADVDQSSMDDYLPPITTQKVALILPPLGMSGDIGWSSPTRTPRLQSHRIPAEFWVKVNNGDLAACLQRGREICLSAARAVVTSGTLGGTVSGVGYFATNGQTTGPSIEWKVDDEMILIGDDAWIRATIYVPVVDYAD